MVINNLCFSAKFSKKIILNGDGSPSRDFINYKTICESIGQILKIEAVGKTNTFHLSSGKSISMLDAAFIVQEVYKKRYKMEIGVYINKDQKVRTKNKQSPSTNLVSIEYIKSKINYIPTPLKEGINSIFCYLDSNKEVKPSANN